MTDNTRALLEQALEVIVANTIGKGELECAIRAELAKPSARVESSTHAIVGRFEYYKDIPIDTTVWVRNEDHEEWVTRYFAGSSKDGKPCTWAGGHTSQTSSGSKIKWECMSITKPD